MRSCLLNNIISLACLASLLIFTGTTHAAEVGNTYFTQHNFMFEKGRHIATNYWRGELVPINSQVELISLKGKKIVLSYKGQNITITNVPKYTSISTDELADRMLSSSHVTVAGKFTSDIKLGTMRLGMTKNEVILARGYAPAHKTPSIESDRWVYWSNKFAQLTLVFNNGVLTQGRGLR